MQDIASNDRGGGVSEYKNNVLPTYEAVQPTAAPENYYTSWKLIILIKKVQTKCINRNNFLTNSQILYQKDQKKVILKDVYISANLKLTRMLKQCVQDQYFLLWVSEK